MTNTKFSTILRRATVNDAAWMREQERLPRNRNLMGSFEVAEHEQNLVNPDYVYLVLEDGGERVAFSILRGFTLRSNSIELLRIVAAISGRSYGRELLRNIMHYVFAEKKRQRLWLQVVHQNDRAIAIYERLGFAREGYLRQQYVTADGLMCDLIVFGMLHPDFEKLSHREQ